MTDTTYADQTSGLLAGLAAKLDLHIGSVSKLTRQVAKGMAKPPAQPVFGRTAATGVVPTGGFLVLRFAQAGPDQGHFWYVRNIVIGGTDPSVTAAGKADVYVSATGLSSQPGLSSLGLSDWRDHYASLPVVSAFYGRGVMPLRLNEELFVVLTGATVGQVYVAAAQYEDYEEGAVGESWSV